MHLRTAAGEVESGPQGIAWHFPQIQRKSRVIWMPEGEDSHVLLAPPGLPGLRIGEGLERYRHSRLEAKILKRCRTRPSGHRHQGSMLQARP